MKMNNGWLHGWWALFATELRKHITKNDQGRSNHVDLGLMSYEQNTDQD